MEYKSILEQPLFECDELLKGEPHCHNNRAQCIQFIEDCKEHAKICFSGCHEKCKCQKERSIIDTLKG